MYVELLKVLYGTLKAALFFYNKFRKTLEENQFQVNPYDVCVANKEVHGTQFTIAWHVDDCKLSHIKENEVTKMIDWFKSKFQDDGIGKIKVSRGKK